MKICSIGIENLKAIDSLRLVPNQSLNVMIGPNNSGKSTVLQAIQALQFLIGLPWSLSPNIIELTTDHQAALFPQVSLSVSLTPYELAQMHPMFHHTDTRIFEMVFEIRTWERDIVVIPRNVDAAPSPSSNDGRSGTIWSYRSQEQQGTHFRNGAMTGTGHLPARNVRGELQKPIGDTSRVEALDPVRFALSQMFFYDPHRVVPHHVPITGPRELDSTANSLARCLNDRFAERDPRLDDYEALISTLLPGIGQLVAPRTPDGSNVFVGFRRDNVTLNIAEMGTGTQQLLAIAYELVFQSHPVIALEEPEAHLHPAAQRSLARAIRKASKTCQVFVVTHSPLFVDRSDYRNNWVFSLDDHRRTCIAPLDVNDPARPIRDAIGVSLGDTLFAGDAIVIVEGSTEISVLPLLNRMAAQANTRSIDLDRVTLISAGGISNVHYLLRTLKGFHVPIIVLADQNKRARQRMAECIAEGLIQEDQVAWVTRPEVPEADAEIEDVLPLEKYLQALSEVYQTPIDVDLYQQTERSLAAERNGRLPVRPHVVGRILENLRKIEPGEGYAKVVVAATAVARMTPQEVPSICDELALLVDRQLQNPQ